MDTTNIKVGDIFAGYTKLCKALGEKSKTNASDKRSHIKRIRNVLEFSKISEKGNKIIIDKVYKNPKVAINKNFKYRNKNCVYAICVGDGSFYIGATNNINRRFSVHKSEIKKSDKNMYRTISENNYIFMILSTHDTYEEMLDHEIKEIYKFKKNGFNLLNSSCGGESRLSNVNRSEFIVIESEIGVLEKFKIIKCRDDEGIDQLDVYRKISGDL